MHFSHYFLTFIMSIVLECTINITFYVWSFYSPSSPYEILKVLAYVLDSPSRKNKGMEAPLTYPNKDFFKNSGKNN